MKVVAFCGSARRDGNTATLLKRVLEVIGAEGIETELIELAGQRAQGCTVCLKCREKRDRRCHGRNDVINACIEKLDAADGIIIGSPVYFADVTPETKALIDRAGYVARSNRDMLRRKAGAGVVAVRRAGAMHALDSIGHFFGISEMVTVNSSYWNVGIGGPSGAVAEDDEGIATMETLGRNMAWLLRLTAHER
jgi:multimeric flavodoxin WrbA